MKIISKKSVILTSLTTLALVMSINSHAKIYKWTDANGQVHYTAQPPAQKKLRIKATNIEDQIKAKAGKYRAPKNVEKTAATDASTKSDSEEKKSDDELAGPDKQLVKYCDGQRNNLAQLKKNFRNIWIDAKGKKTNLTQEQRKEKVAILQNEINSNCSEVKTSKS